MRILFLSDNFPPESNAPASRTYEHARRWVEDGHEVTVITCAPNFPEGRLYSGYRNSLRHVEIMEGIRVVRVKTYITANDGVFRRSLDYLSFAAAGMLAGLCEKRPDVVVATTPQFFCALAGWVLAGIRGLPFVLELRDLWPASIVAVGAMSDNLTIRLLERLELFLYRRAAAIVSVTEAFQRDLVRRGIEPSKISVVRNGADLTWCRKRPRDRNLERHLGLGGKFVVGYLGTHGMAHALPGVLEAVSLLRRRDDIVFVFAGGGAARAEVERTVTSKGLSNVRLLARQPKQMMGALWSVCDLSLMPLRNDPVFATVVPSKLFEAMANGVPTLASLPEGEATRIVRSTGCGVVVNPESPNEMAVAIESLADDGLRLMRLRDAGLAAASRFSRDRLARDMTVAFAAAIRAAGSRRSGSRRGRKEAARFSSVFAGQEISESEAERHTKLLSERSEGSLAS